MDTNFHVFFQKLTKYCEQFYSNSLFEFFKSIFLGWNKKATETEVFDVSEDSEALHLGDHYCPTGIYRHPFRCDMFFQCNEGHRYENQKCPPGLKFNRKEKYCDWPENVKC